MAGDALQVLDEAGIERAHVFGASLGGMIAQELAVTAPERVDKLVLCCTTPGGPDAVPMPEVTLRAVRRGPVTRTRGGAPALRRERARRRSAGGARRRALRAAEWRTRPIRPGWQAQAAAGMGFQGVDGEITAPTLILAGTADNVVDYRNAELLAARIPGCARRAARRRRASVLLGAAGRVRQDRSTSFSDERAHHRQDHPRPRQDHARPDRDRGAAAEPGRTPSSTRARTSWRGASRTATVSRR